MSYYFETKVPKSSWGLSNYMYSVRVPLLGNTLSGNLDVTISNEANTITINHVNYDCQSRVEVEIPDNYQMIVSQKITYDTRYRQEVKNFDLYRTDNPITLILRHNLRDEWWRCVVDLCRSAKSGDINNWKTFWNKFMDIKKEFLKDKVCPNWSQGGCMYILPYIHQSLSENKADSLYMLDTLLREGDITQEDIMKRKDWLLIEKEPDENWVKIKTLTWKDKNLCIHRDVIKHFNIDTGIVYQNINFYNYLPILGI
jgi:hypothetical protein